MKVRFRNSFGKVVEQDVETLVLLALDATPDLDGMLARLIKVLVDNHALSVEELGDVVNWGEIEEVK